MIARLSMCAGAVYPRWRGEHPMTLFYSFPFTGLSPLARGTHFNPHLFLLLRRFIPAGAGNTGSTRPRRAAAPVYPRWRGEHLPAIYLPVAAFGLSPLARGTLLPIASRARIARFIPAGAGNTSATVSIRVSLSVYPRWRGEHKFPRIVVLADFGLSPLARGTRALRRCGGCLLRFIPAGAGNTLKIYYCFIIAF